MTKAELIALLSEKADQSQKTVNEILQGFTDMITDALVRGERLSLPGLGTFDVKTRAARQGRNPRTGEPMAIEAARVPYFKAARLLKTAVNEKTDTKKTTKRGTLKHKEGCT